MKLEVGEFYLSAYGTIDKIEKKRDNAHYPLEGISMYSYLENGKYEDINIDDGLDLIAHIPKQLHYELLRVVNEYHTNKEFKSMIDINFDKRK